MCKIFSGLTNRQLQIFYVSLQSDCCAKQSEKEAIFSDVVDPSNHDVSSLQVPVQHGSSFLIWHLHEYL